MTDLKFLLTTYSTAFTVSGGGESEQVQVSEMLNECGIQADIYGIGSRPLSYYDGVIHFSIHADGHAILREAILKNKRIFLWPNVWWNEAPSTAEIQRIDELCHSTHMLLFKSRSELENFTQYISISPEKLQIIPTGISNRFLTEPDKDLFSAISDITDYVLCMGLIEPVKNQLSVIRALNKLKLNGVFVGGVRDDCYYLECTNEAHAGIIFLPFIQPCSALLRSIIANCKLMVEASIDPPGRSSLEGALMKKPLVIADGPWQREHFSDNVWYAPTDSYSDLAKAILDAKNDASHDKKIAASYELVSNRHSAATFATNLASLLARESI